MPAGWGTDYITEHEIPIALELHAAQKTVVVPIVLEACRWDKTKLGALNALPEKAKPLSQWTRASDAWKTVADGLAVVFQKLIERREREDAGKRAKQKRRTGVRRAVEAGRKTSA